MSDYTIVNLKQIEDSAGQRNPQVEGRFGRRHLDSEHLGISYFRYAPDFRSDTAHRHREQEEAYVVLSGSGRILLDDEVRELGPWDVVRVGPGTLRAIQAGPDGLEFLAVASDRPEGGDGEPQPADWPG